MDRRTFLTTTALTSLSTTALGQTFNLIEEAYGESVFSHSLPKLPYAYNALEPYIDEKTMEIHHSKHHQAYITRLERAESELLKMRETGDYGFIEYRTKKLSFHLGGHILHSLFWNSMGPKSGNMSSELTRALVRDFGSVEKFRAQFSSAANSVEGSGWAVLGMRPVDKKLFIFQIENQHKLLPAGVLPILLLDVWEHAYYLKYQNKRADYVAAWWNVVDWEAVSERFAR